jgi:hypothetical protein
MTFTAIAVNAELRRLVVETIDAGERSSVRSRIREAAKLLGMPFGRVRRYQYGEVRRIEAHEAFNIIEKTAQVKRERLERKRLTYEAERLEMANSAPSPLARLLPPSMAWFRALEDAPE